MKKLVIAFLTMVMFVPASAKATERKDADELMATLLNLQGYLCARVISVVPLDLPKHYEVRCIEYRGGNGTVDYIVNLGTGEAIKR